MNDRHLGNWAARLRGGLCGVVFLGSLPWAAEAIVKPAAVFSDHMVLQRDSPSKIWGTSAPQESVTVEFAGQKKNATADAGGNWCVCLDPLAASADPRVMAVSGTASGDAIKIQDVLVGEVWVIAGGLPVAQRLIHLLPNVDQAVTAAKAEPVEPRLRVFSAKPKVDREVQAGTDGSWLIAEARSMHELPADGYYVGRRLVAELGVPVGVVSIAMAWPGQPIETWMSREALAKNPAARPILDYYAGDVWKMRAVGTYEERVKAWMDYCQKLPLNPPPKPEPSEKPESLVGQEPSAVWNAMVAPLTRLAVRGVVWDHGEDDGGPRGGVGSLQRAVQYGQLLPGLIADWRQAFGNPELPFAVVQLRPFFNSKPHGISTWLAAEMRDAQREGAVAAKAAYVVSIDLPKDPHPREVCPRIADALLAKAYKKAGLAVDGPECVGAEIVGNKVILRFRNAEGGLLAKGGGPLSGFALASAERFRWVWADAVIKGDTVEVSAPAVEKPEGVRYAYQDLPERGANLCNAAGCPAAPFRTDIQPTCTGEALNPGVKRRGPARSDFVEDPRLPRILILGDSITSHYFYGVRDQLRSRANVLGEAGTEKGAWVDTARFYRADWASRGDDLKNFLAERGPFDIVHFNNGIHNFARAKPGDEVPYAEQLRKVVATIRASGAVCLFANSTGTIGDNKIPNSPNYLTNCKAFNAAAEKVMAELGVPVTDIFGATQPRIEELISQDLVHFKGEAGAIMAAAIVARLHETLDKLAAEKGAVCDVVVYGGTAAGVAAAVQACRMGCSVVLVEPTRRLGGLSSGGLGQTDIGNKAAIGGLARQFYRDVFTHYDDPAAWIWQQRKQYRDGGQTRTDSGEDAMWTFEPSVALNIFKTWIKTNNIEVVYGERLDRAAGVALTRSVPWRILSVKMESGRTFRGKVFIDATYEGDLMAAAKVSYTVGREANEQYGETLNGVQATLDVKHRHHRFVPRVDPYVEKGKQESGLLPFLDPAGPGTEGAGDRRVQAYCYRMCLTDKPENRIPFFKPEGYDPLWYELLLRNFEAGEAGMPWINSAMPNCKTDTNNRTGFSTDFIGQNYDYPEASYAEREKIAARHRLYQQGLMWTLANHPRVPEKIRTEVARWGMCRDEFAEGLGWQEQLYVREARRMVSDLVMTQHHCQGREHATDPVGLAAYGMDSHNVQRYVDKEGHAQNEGDVEVGGFDPYPIGYRAIVPKKSECSNLLVPVCVSASHIAYGSIRMEPVFMVLGQSAATAAFLAIQQNVAVQDVDGTKLRERLLADGQILSWEPKADGK